MKKLRVVHFGTGLAGAGAIRQIVHHADLELVGHYVHSPEKIGKDSGELSDARKVSPVPLGKIGVKTTNSWKDLLALKPDCLCYCADARAREPEAIQEMVPFLEQGANVVTTSILPLTYPPAGPADLRDPIERACTKGRTSFYNGGIDPGYATSHLPLSLLQLAGPVKTIRMQELGDYAEFPVEWLMRDVFGFGRPVEWERPIYQGGALHRWKGTVVLIADAIGLKLDDVKMVCYPPVTYNKDVETSWGPVKAGTTAGVRFEIQGIVKGEPRVILEHVSYIHRDAVPDWSKPVGEPGKMPPHQYTVRIEGDPNISCMLDLPTTEESLLYTANHVVNAIPAVCAAKPGLLSALDIPFYVPKIENRA